MEVAKCVLLFFVFFFLWLNLVYLDADADECCSNYYEDNNCSIIMMFYIGCWDKNRVRDD